MNEASVSLGFKALLFIWSQSGDGGAVYDNVLQIYGGGGGGVLVNGGGPEATEQQGQGYGGGGGHGPGLQGIIILEIQSND